VARLGTQAAARLGLADGELLTVTGPAGPVTLPVRLTELPGDRIGSQTTPSGSEVRAGLGAGPGAVVTLKAGGRA
jgi:NADH-quinone oxidoreductase subunit G